MIRHLRPLLATFAVLSLVAGISVLSLTPMTAPVSAQTMTNAPSADGRIGPLGTCQDQNGQVGRCVFPAMTATNPTSVTSRIISSAASTNATVAKATPCTLYGAFGYNTNAAARYLKIYNKATAPTVGTDVPVLTVYLPPTSSFNISLTTGGLNLSNGCAYALTTGAPDADTGAVTAGDIIGLNVLVG